MAFDLDCHSIGIQGGMYEPGKWHFVTAVYDTHIRLYVATQQVASLQTTLDTTDADTFKVGRNTFGHTGAYFDGTIDEVMVFDCALSQEEICKLLMKLSCLSSMPSS